ncbi:MAG: hypothetical protein QW830_01835 [Nitrososphaerales archaeon]
MSAILPKGRRNIAVAKRYEAVTQPNKIASVANSFPIRGRAILIEDIMKGARKEAKVVTSNPTLLFTVLCIMIAI